MATFLSPIKSSHILTVVPSANALDEKLHTTMITIGRIIIDIDFPKEIPSSLFASSAASSSLSAASSTRCVPAFFSCLSR